MKNDFSSQDPEILKILKDLDAHKVEYPAELLAARRDAFLKQVEEHTKANTHQAELPILFDELQSREGDYPADLFVARRAAFRRQASRLARGSIWDMWVFAFQKRFASLTRMPRLSTTLRTSMLAAGMALMVLAAFAFYRTTDQLAARPTEFRNGFSALVPSPAEMTATPMVICRQGYVPPLCLVKQFDKSQDLTDPRNGTAKPAVAKDTLHQYGEFHQAAYINDGLYGPGASWVSESPDSWVKIDMGTSRVINTITFGRDRLGTLNDGDPGRFIISVAEADNVYADGNSNNDEVEYVQVYDSQQAGFDGVISGPETVMAQFNSQKARFIKITFENAGTAVDEVQVFMLQPPLTSQDPTLKPNEDQPADTAVPAPVNTDIPTATFIPTDTPLPSATSTPFPTQTLLPTETPPLPTETPVPLPTDTPPYFTPTEIVVPTDTPAY
jgi:hypothetical protein